MSDEQATADTEEAEAKVEGPLAELLDYLVDSFGDRLIESSIEKGELALVVAPRDVFGVISFLTYPS